MMNPAPTPEAGRPKPAASYRSVAPEPDVPGVVSIYLNNTNSTVLRLNALDHAEGTAIGNLLQWDEGLTPGIRALIVQAITTKWRARDMPWWR